MPDDPRPPAAAGQPGPGPGTLDRALVGELFDAMHEAFTCGHGVTVDIIVAALAGTARASGGPTADGIAWAAGKLRQVIDGAALGREQHPPLVTGMPPRPRSRPPRCQDPD